ncbi:DUF2437 domain-containing protein [Rhizorhabdus histidinilytica]
MRIARFRIADGRILHGLVEGDVVKLLADPPAGGIETWLQAGAFDEAISRTEGKFPIGHSAAGPDSGASQIPGAWRELSFASRRDRTSRYRRAHDADMVQ